MRDELHFLLQFPLSWLVKITVACICGAIIGLEREVHRKAAGIRTNVMICMGSTLFMLAGELISMKFGMQGIDQSRIAGQIIVGMGFIGAGTIMQGRGQVTGLTSAATMWVVAGIGVIIGIGYPALGLILTLFVIVLLIALGKVVHIVLGKCKMTHITISFKHNPETVAAIENILSAHGHELDTKHMRIKEDVCFMRVDYCTVHPQHSELILDILKIPDVRQSRAGA